MRLKGIIFGIDNVLVTEGQVSVSLHTEIGKLIKFLFSKQITPVVLANREWTAKTDTGRRPLEDVINQEWGKFPWFVANRDNLPHKSSTEATRYVLNAMGWNTAEVLYVGSTKTDMQTAVNGQLLFLNATWFSKITNYGIEFNSPRDVAQFIDTFCLREHHWYYSIVNDQLEYYALAPFSTRKPQFADYSEDARAAAKSGRGHPDFWTKYLCSTIYFSELHKRINFIAAYPGHEVGSGNAVMDQALAVFARCFRVTYLRDFIIRHTKSTKSQTARIQGLRLDHLNQLNTIMLNEYPLRSAGDERYKNCPVKKDKTILIVDDICTRGFSLEAARAYIEQTGARIICLSWLKTINSDYEQLHDAGRFSPFQPNIFSTPGRITHHPYRNFIIDHDAPEELSARLEAYDKWIWPSGI